jgi:Holin of 3TMs, for gene-transfer release
MTIPILGDIIKEVGSTVRELIPDADKRMEFDLKFAELADKVDERENALLIAQTQVNLEEAKSANLFVAGWRPAVGWTCVVALNWTFFVAPLITWVAHLFGSPVLPPEMDTSQLMTLVLGMLGLSVSRSYEKSKGVATSIGGQVLQPAQKSPATITATEPIKKNKWF